MKTLAKILFRLIPITLLVAACSGSPSTPQLSGATCDELARSYGKDLHTRALAALDSARWPDDKADENARGTVAYQLSEDLRELDLQAARALMSVFDPATFPDCTPERFLSAAEQEFGQRFRNEVSLAHVYGFQKPDWAWYRDLLKQDIEVAMADSQGAKAGEQSQGRLGS